MDVSGSKATFLNDEPNITYYVNHVIPSIFPFLRPHIQVTLRTALLTDDASNALIHCSTLAHCLVLQKVGLERMGVPFDTSGEKAADRQRSDAMESIRSVLGQIDKEDANAGTGSDANVACCVLQLVLLQVEKFT